MFRFRIIRFNRTLPGGRTVMARTGYRVFHLGVMIGYVIRADRYWRPLLRDGLSLGLYRTRQSASHAILRRPGSTTSPAQPSQIEQPAAPPPPRVRPADGSCHRCGEPTSFTKTLCGDCGPRPVAAPVAP
jgi:hypothetical protein